MNGRDRGSMKFILPNGGYKEQAVDFIREMNLYSSPLNGGSRALNRCLDQSSYECWLEKVMADRDIANIKPGWVPAFTYFYVREEDDRIIGMVCIRPFLNDTLRKTGGHIGYSIRPTERRKHYGTRLLQEALEVCRSIDLRRVLVTCDRENLASRGVIENGGGKVDSEFYDETSGEVVRRYIIDLDGEGKMRKRGTNQGKENENGIHIRSMVASDYDATAALCQELMNLHATGDPSIFAATSPDIADDFEAWLNEERFVAMVAETDDGVVGVCVGCLLPDKVKEHFIPRRLMRIDDLIVAQGCHHQGIGQKLFESQVEAARVQGIEAISLNVYSFNETARTFYEAMGMHCVSMKYEMRIS